MQQLILVDSLLVYSKTGLKRLLKMKAKIGFQDRLSLNAGHQESILQYFRPSVSYHLSLRPLFCLFLSGCLRQVLLYIYYKCNLIQYTEQSYTVILMNNNI